MGLYAMLMKEFAGRMVPSERVKGMLRLRWKVTVYITVRVEERRTETKRVYTPRLSHEEICLAEVIKCFEADGAVGTSRLHLLPQHG